MTEHTESDDTNVLLAFGGEIKALGGGKLGGYLVRYTDATRPDLTGDFFTPQTDFDIEPGDRVSVYYNHGLDATLKRRKIGSGTIKLDDAGVWVEAQLALRDDYERAIYQMAEAGKLGWSSGTLPNLVERESEGKAARIVTWPLGKDASLTPTPAAGLVLTAVQPLKSWAAAMEGNNLMARNRKVLDLGMRFDMVRRAVEKRYGPSDTELASDYQFVYCEYIYEDFVIVRRDMARFKIPYTLTETEVTLGEAAPVEMSWTETKTIPLAQFDQHGKQVLPGQPVTNTTTAHGTEAAATEDARSASLPAVDARKRLELEIAIMEVEL